MPQKYRILDNGIAAESKRQKAMKPKAKKLTGSQMRQKNASKAASGVMPAKGRGGVDGSYVGRTEYNAKQRKKAQGKRK